MAQTKQRNSNSKRYAKDRLEFNYVCTMCGKHYTAHWPHSTTCSNKCRQAKFRAEKKGNGKTWHSVKPEFCEKAMLIRKVSETAYNAIYDVLVEYGATVAEKAIGIAWEAMEGCASALSDNG